MENTKSLSVEKLSKYLLISKNFGSEFHFLAGFYAAKNPDMDFDEVVSKIEQMFTKSQHLDLNAKIAAFQDQPILRKREIGEVAISDP